MMYMRQLPGGLCFAHGPYHSGYSCPQYPACLHDPAQQQWKDLAFSHAKRHALVTAAGLLEKEGLLPEVVAQLRHKAEDYAARRKVLDDLARAEHDEGIYDRMPDDPNAGQ